MTPPLIPAEHQSDLARHYSVWPPSIIMTRAVLILAICPSELFGSNIVICISWGVATESASRNNNYNNYYVTEQLLLLPLDTQQLGNGLCLGRKESVYLSGERRVGGLGFVGEGWVGGWVVGRQQFVIILSIGGRARHLSLTGHFFKGLFISTHITWF